MVRMSFLNAERAPLVIEPAPASFDSLIETVFGNRQFFREKLLTHGVLLFRGYDVDGVSKFERFVRLFSGKEFFNYAGGVSPRVPLSDGVYTSTEYPAQFMLSLHNELSYADAFPNHLYFCCLTAPESGGETTIGDSRRILQKIDSEIVEMFRRKKICYIRNLQAEKGSGYSWQEAFETDCRLAVENHCKRIGAELEWKPCGGLRLKQTRPATLTHPVTGEEVWFNQADGFHPSNLGEEIYQTFSEDELRLNCCFGDGSPIDLDVLRHVRAILESEMIPHKWQEGDILVLDNILSAHGRMPFSGKRKISLAMT
jgi:alpha-ketoglutarate-dependent taurine dioxygenase